LIACRLTDGRISRSISLFDRIRRWDVSPPRNHAPAAVKEETVMTFVVVGVVLLLALLVGTVFDDEEPSEDDPAV
jgi:hypothetical protein